MTFKHKHEFLPAIEINSERCAIYVRSQLQSIRCIAIVTLNGNLATDRLHDPDNSDFWFYMLGSNHAAASLHMISDGEQYCAVKSVKKDANGVLKVTTAPKWYKKSADFLSVVDQDLIKQCINLYVNGQAKFNFAVNDLYVP